MCDPNVYAAIFQPVDYIYCPGSFVEIVQLPLNNFARLVWLVVWCRGIGPILVHRIAFAIFIHRIVRRQKSPHTVSAIEFIGVSCSYFVPMTADRVMNGRKKNALILQRREITEHEKK